MKFKELSNYFERIEKTSSRLEMTDLLAEVFNNSSPEEAAIVAYLITGRVAPMFIPIEFNVAEKLLLRVLEGLVIAKGSRKDAGRLFDKLGDLGLAAEQLIKDLDYRGKNLSIKEVYDQLWEVAQVSGQGSVEIRNQKMHNLVTSLSAIEARYALRILSQKLRLGCSSKTVLDALSVVQKGDKSDRDEIEYAFGVSSDLGYVVATYLNKGKKGIETIDVTPGVPVFSMLVEREKDVESIMKRIPNPIVQPKFDGLRCQIHIGEEDEKPFKDRIWWSYMKESESGQGGLLLDNVKEKRIRLFSRNLEDMTEMFPEVVKAVAQLDVDSAVLDSEVIGYNEDTGEFAPFQETMIRKRKYEISDAAKKTPVKAFVFDALFLGGKSLLRTKNLDRIAKAEEVVPEEGVIIQASNYYPESAKGLQEVFDEKVSEGLEGVIIKDPQSFYQPGKRGFDWIKLKRASQGHLADTVDVVILGYYFGRGRQVDFGIGALLSGVYDKDKDKFVTLAKIGTGVTDEQWKEIKLDLDDLKVDDRPKNVVVDKTLEPDQWVEPQIVATVEADEITRSPIHTAGRVGDDPGYALRFPRLKDWNRDKLPEDSTSVKEVIEMAGNQVK